MATEYANAVYALAETGVEHDILFTRISDADASTLAWMAGTNPKFRAAVLKANAVSGLIDTLVLSAAKA